MRPQVAIGAVAVLSLAVLGPGCPPEDDKILPGPPSADLPGNLDVIPGMSLPATNALAPDGGGLSENDTSIDIATGLRVVFNCDAPDSDGPDGSDGTALVLFQTTNGAAAPADYVRVYATHWDGAFTPPVELRGPDRDERVAVDLQSYVCVPLNTRSYQAGSAQGQSQDSVNQVRANDGNWLVLGELTTAFQDPALAGAGGNQTTQNARGPRRALASWLFLESQRQNAISAVSIGGVTRTFRYGFEKLGQPVNTAFPGGGCATTNVPAGVGPSKLAVPPNDVTSYGVVSDTLCGQASFGGDALPFSTDGAPGTPDTYDPPGALGAGSTAFAFAIPHVSSSAADPMALQVANRLGLRAASYRVGEQTSLIVAVWTQVCNSFSGGGSFTSSAQTAHQGGHELQLRYRTFNLATLAWENDEAELPGTAERNGAATSQRAGSAPFPHFKVYNQFLFAKYADASLNLEFGGVTNQNLLALRPGVGAGQHDWFQTEVGGHEGGRILQAGAARPGFWEEVVMALRFVDDGDGSASLASSNARVDLSSTAETRSAVGVHTLTNPSITNDSQVGDTYPDRELANWNGEGTSILGPDQGAGDITVFLVVSDGTNTAANPNVDRELVAAALSLDGSPVAGTNPRRISGTHQEDYHGQTNALGNPGADAFGTNEANNRTSLEDPLVIRGLENGAGGADRSVTRFTASSDGPTWFELVLNRTGEWAAIAFLKDTGLSAPATGTSGSFSQDLHVVAYQLFRPGSTAAPLEARFVGPSVVNDQLLGPISLPGARQGYPVSQPGGFHGSVIASAEGPGNWRGLPVNDYRWQQGVHYRTGFQSDKEVITLLYEQSDATEDRVFLRRVRIEAGPLGTPTLTLGPGQEVDANDQVPSHRSHNEVQFGATVAGPATFRFIDETAQIEDWRTFDAGIHVGTNGACLVLYVKIVDNTTSDGDHADAQLRALRFFGGVAGPVAIDAGVDENASVEAAAGDALQSTPLVGANQGVKALFARVGPAISAVVGTPNSSDLSQSPSHPASPVTTSSKVLVLFREREAGANVQAGVALPTANASSRRGQFLRALHVGSTADFDDLWEPSAQPAKFALPLQVDHEQGIVDDTTFVTQSLRAGGIWTLVLEANSQLWLQEVEVSEGQGFTAASPGQPTSLTTLRLSFATPGVDRLVLSNPALLSNDSSSDLVGQRVFRCGDARGDERTLLVFFSKNDRDGDRRLQARTRSLR